MKTRALLLAAAILVMLGCTLVWSGSPSSGSRSVPFPIGKAGATVTAELLVPEKRPYTLLLQYEFKKNHRMDRARAWKLAGGTPVEETPGKWIVEPGAELRIRVNVSRRQEDGDRVIEEKTIDRPRITSWDDKTIVAELLNVSLDPGSYVFTVTSLDDAPLFVGAPTNLFLGRAYSGK